MKSVLFVCVENAGRSQMAEGFARHHGRGLLNVASAGSRPLGRIHAQVVEVMREKGIELEGQHSKSLQEVDLSAFELLVTLCAEEECPLVPIPERRNWGMPNPAGQGLDTVREIRDAIERKVLGLVDEARGA